MSDFEAEDADEIVEILKFNHQYHFPQVDGPGAMNRIKKWRAALVTQVTKGDIKTIAFHVRET